MFVSAYRELTAIRVPYTSFFVKFSWLLFMVLWLTIQCVRSKSYGDCTQTVLALWIYRGPDRAINNSSQSTRCLSKHARERVPFDWLFGSEWLALNTTHPLCLCVRAFPIPGRSPLPAALCPLGLLPRPSEARVPHLPSVSGLRVADVPAVSPGPGAGRATATAASPGGLRLRLWDLPLQ